MKQILKKRIIPCLDIKDNRVVKGVNFTGLSEVGDPVEMAKKYAAEGADEIVLLDISATVERRKTFASLVEKVAKEITIPIIVGGGISSSDEAKRVFDSGAAKVSINSSAVERPALIDELAGIFGSERIIIAIDGKECQEGNNSVNKVVTHSGERFSQKELFAWALECEKRGAGEILYTSMDFDGTKKGYDCKSYKRLSEILSIPIIASGGAGSIEDICKVLSKEGGNADAALAASLFHYGIVTIPELKRALAL